MRTFRYPVPSWLDRNHRRVGWVLAVAILLQLAVAVAPVRADPLAPASTAVGLHDDDGGAALFGSGGLHPGRIDRACVAVSVSGSAPASGQVHLSAELGRDGLAPFLALTVERGTVGAFGNCASFTGETLWSGTLADFPATAANGIPTGWRPADLSRVVYRFTVTVLDDPRAQRLEASATFIWTLIGTEPASVAPPTPTTPADPVPTAPATSPSEPEEAAVSPPTPIPSSPGAPPPAGEAYVGDVVEAPALVVAPSTIQQVTETALELVRNGHFPLLLLAVLAAFLLLQGALDRRDPKLALARTHQELREFRQFPDGPRTDPT